MQSNNYLILSGAERSEVEGRNAGSVRMDHLLKARSLGTPIEVDTK
jgi:hypothetical protein